MISLLLYVNHIEVVQSISEESNSMWACATLPPCTDSETKMYSTTIIRNSKIGVDGLIGPQMKNESLSAI